MGAPGPADLLTDILESVSRSFYLTLKMLPAAVRPQIGLAYLLARTSDTIADTELIAAVLGQHGPLNSKGIGSH